MMSSGRPSSIPKRCQRPWSYRNSPPPRTPPLLNTDAAAAEEAVTSGADPEGAGRGFAQDGDAVVVEDGSVLAIEGGEVDAVETCQTFVGADPDVAVAGLRDGEDGVEGESVTGEPDLADVLRQDFVWVEGVGSGGVAQQDDEAEQPAGHTLGGAMRAGVAGRVMVALNNLPVVLVLSSTLRYWWIAWPAGFRRLGTGEGNCWSVNLFGDVVLSGKSNLSRLLLPDNALWVINISQHQRVSYIYHSPFAGFK